jgi:hypothetical protein
MENVISTFTNCYPHFKLSKPVKFINFPQDTVSNTGIF